MTCKTAQGRLKQQVWTLFSKYIRLRDCLATTGTRERGRCITCGEEFPIEKLQAGHFIAGRRNANLFSKKGCHAQCARCNVYLNGNTLEYRRQIIKLYGEGYDELLEREAKQVKKFTVGELEQMKDFYTQKVKALEGKCTKNGNLAKD